MDVVSLLIQGALGDLKLLQPWYGKTTVSDVSFVHDHDDCRYGFVQAAAGIGPIGYGGSLGWYFLTFASHR
jgi:hypothetical protein